MNLNFDFKPLQNLLITLNLIYNKPIYYLYEEIDGKRKYITKCYNHTFLIAHLGNHYDYDSGKGTNLKQYEPVFKSEFEQKIAETGIYKIEITGGFLLIVYKRDLEKIKETKKQVIYEAGKFDKFMEKIKGLE